MATKRFYWIKLKETFFTSAPIKRMRKLAGGDTYVIIYLKMMLMSMNNNGVISYEGEIDSFTNNLAVDLDESEENVQMTLCFLARYNLLEYNTNQEALLTEVPLFVGSESESAEKMRRKRERDEEKKRLAELENNETVTLESQLGHNVTLDIRDRDIDIEKEKINKKEKPQKHAYGEYKNVYLTDVELEKLQAEFPVDWKRRIETMSGWLAANGRCYKNYLAALRNWAKRDNNNKTNPLVQEHKKKDFNSYWEEAVRRRKDLTNVGWSHPVVYNLAKKIQWNEKNLDFERTLFMVGLNEYDAQHPNEL